MATSLGELQEVQRQVAAAARDENVYLNLNNGRVLTSSLINSPTKSLPDEQKEAKACEIPRVAYSAFSSRANLESVGVIFVVHRSYLLFFNYTDAADLHRFTARELSMSRSETGTSGN